MTPLSASQLHDCVGKTTRSFIPGQIDVWLLSAKIDAAQRTFYERVLSPEEHERAQRFRFPADQDRSIASRGGLRWILSSYLETDPATLTFQTASGGKPSISTPLSQMQFNVSHAGDCVLIGVTGKAECGVDIEQWEPRVSEQEIAEGFFCRREAEWMKHVEWGFIRLWTIKEAILKAAGWGLSMPLNAIDVSDVAEGITSQLLVETETLGPRFLWVKELDLLEGYAASVAATGTEHTVRLEPF